MSLKTWIEEFYPTSARSAENAAPLELVRHSLKKWRGLTEDNMKRHDVEKYTAAALIFDSENKEMRIGSENCALCTNSFIQVKGDESAEDGHCEYCHLYKENGRRCSESDIANDWDSEWDTWVNRGDPLPMITLLEQLESTFSEKEDGTTKP